MTETTPPNFLDRMQSAEREQDLVQLRTLLAQHQLSLQRLPRLATELKTFIESPDTLDLRTLTNAMQTALAQANELLLAIDLVPVDYPDQPELLAIGERLLPLVSSGTVVALRTRFAQVRDSAAEAARVVQAQQAKAAAESASQASTRQAMIDRQAAALALGFIDHGDGTVTDTHHKLMWKQYAEGNIAGLRFDWTTAMEIPNTMNLRGGFAGYSDWRLPTSDELASLVMHGRFDPAMCTEAFPSAQRERLRVWASSPTADNKYKFVINFHYGSLETRECHEHNLVMLVRSSQ